MEELVLMLFRTVPIIPEQITAQNGKVLENTEAKREQRDIVEIDAEAVTDKDECRRKQGI